MEDKVAAASALLAEIRQGVVGRNAPRSHSGGCHVSLHLVVLTGPHRTGTERNNPLLKSKNKSLNGLYIVAGGEADR